MTKKRSTLAQLVGIISYAAFMLYMIKRNRLLKKKWKYGMTYILNLKFLMRINKKSNVYQLVDAITKKI